MIHKVPLIFSYTQELELYKEELLSKPSILVINKMDLPEAEDKLRELQEQLENQEGSHYSNMCFLDLRVLSSRLSHIFQTTLTYSQLYMVVSIFCNKQ